MRKSLLFLQKWLFVSMVIGFFTLGLVQGEEVYSPREKLVLMQ